MANFPNTFVERMRPLPADLGEAGNEAAASLAERGYVVEAGFTPYLAGAIGQMATQPHIVEFCWKDETAARFESEDSSMLWSGKNGGRAPFGVGRILANDGRRWVGYDWTGLEPCEELPDHPITSAYRLGQEGLRQGLAVPVIKLIVLGSAALYGHDPTDVGLETSGSNPAGDKYIVSGFDDVIQKRGVRRTQKPVGSVININVTLSDGTELKEANVVRESKDGTHNEVDDIRRFMANRRLTFEGLIAA